MRVVKEHNFDTFPKRLFNNYDPTNQFTTSLVTYEDGQGVQLCENIECSGMDDFPNDLWQKWEQLGLGKIKRIMIIIMSEDC